MYFVVLILPHRAASALVSDACRPSNVADISNAEHTSTQFRCNFAPTTECPHACMRFRCNFAPYRSAHMQSMQFRCISLLQLSALARNRLECGGGDSEWFEQSNDVYVLPFLMCVTSLCDSRALVTEPAFSRATCTTVALISFAFVLTAALCSHSALTAEHDLPAKYGCKATA